jgi:DNA-binding IclR family transcriptional regulator
MRTASLALPFRPDNPFHSVDRSEQQTAQETPYAVRAALRALDILDALQEAPDGLSLPQLAERVALPKSSIFRYLATLEARGYVERDGGQGRFRLGRRLLPAHSQRLERLTQAAQPHLEGLRDRFQETVNLGVFDSGRVRYLQIVESPQAMRFAAREDDRDPIHSTALGKAIASQLSREHVLRILETEGMPKLTSRTIADPDAFLRELDEVRRSGFAVDNGENEEGGRCVAVPLPLEGVRAAISVSAPAFRFTLEDVEPVAAMLVRIAQSVAQKLTREDA